MRYRSSGSGVGTGLDFLFRPGRPSLGTFLVAIWAGFMVATAGAAVYPPVTALVTPFVCGGRGAQVDSQTFSNRPGQTIVTRDFQCIGENGKAESAMTRTLVATGAAYALIAFLLLTLVGLWRGRGGRAAAAASAAETAPVEAAALPPDLDLLRARTAQLRERMAQLHPGAAAGGDIGARLEVLESLREAGLIGDADYAAKKAEILSRL